MVFYHQEAPGRPFKQVKAYCANATKQRLMTLQAQFIVAVKIFLKVFTKNAQVLTNTNTVSILDLLIPACQLM